MGLYRRPDSNMWWMSFAVDGVQYRRSTETEDDKLADVIYAKVRTQINEGKWFDIDKSKTTTFDELMEEYFNLIDDEPSTLSRKEDALAHLKEHFSGLTLDKITATLIDKYKKKRRQANAADSTILNETRLLSHAYNTVGWTRDNPVKGAKAIKLKAGEVDRWLTAEEEEALLAKCDGKLDGDLTDIVTLDLNTGLSQEEVLKLDWRQIDLFRKTLTTGRKKTERRGLNMRTIPLDEEAYALLKRRASTGGMSGCVFHDKAGNMTKANRLKKEFRKAVKQSGIAHFRFHDCRHTFATRLAQRGVDLYTISKLLGHRSILSTQRYAHHYVESLRNGVKVLDKTQDVATRKRV